MKNQTTTIMSFEEYQKHYKLLRKMGDNHETATRRIHEEWLQ